MKRIFISDLHLDEQRPQITRALFSFLEQQAKFADELYILGDFFEAWVGDDHNSPFISEIKQHLRRFAQTGIPVFFIHGNRDFLIGETFASESNWTLLSELTELDWSNEESKEGPNKKIVIMHGDSLCTDDQEYMAFRQQVRSPAWQTEFLNKSLAERLAIAKHLREQSKEAYSNKSASITDVTAAEVERVFAATQCDLLIHGHTHRPAIHAIHAIDEGDKKRIVLGDWDKLGWYLQVDDAGYRLENFPIS